MQRQFNFLNIYQVAWDSPFNYNILPYAWNLCAKLSCNKSDLIKGGET